MRTRYRGEYGLDSTVQHRTHIMNAERQAIATLLFASMLSGPAGDVRLPDRLQATASPQDMPADYKDVLTALGKTGDFKDGVLKVNIPRADLTVTIAGR